jgi:hypothetical protein
VAEAGINTIPLGGFTPGSGYTFHIVVADAAGNLSAVLGIPFSPRKLGVDPAKDRAEQNEAALIAAGEIALEAPRASGGSAQVGITLGEDGRIAIAIDGAVTEYPYTISGGTLIVAGGGSGGGDAALGFVIGEEGTLTLEGLEQLAGGGLASGAVVSEPDPGLIPVAKAAGGAVGTLGGSSAGTTITATAVTVDNDEQEPEYAISTGEITPDTNWQPEPTFEGLTVGETYYVYARAGESANYRAGTAVRSAAITVGKLNQAAFKFAAETVDKTYGDAPAAYVATGGSGDGAISYAVTEGDGAVSVDAASGAVTILQAGTGQITATKAADATYNAATAPLTVTVAPLPLTATVTAATRDYADTTAVTLTITVVNKVDGDDVAITATGTMADANVGTGKAVAISGIALTGEAAGNYAAPASITGVTVTITKAAISPVVTAASFTAPGTPAPQVAGGGNPGGGAVSYTYAAAVDGDYSAAVPANAGTYWVKAAVAETANYQGGASAAARFDIYPAGKPGITAWVKNHAIVTDPPGGTATLSKAGPGGVAQTLTVEVTDDEYGTSYQWSIGGVVQEAKPESGGKVFIFDSEHRDTGKYWLALRVTKDGVPYTTTIAITVEK